MKRMMTVHLLQFLLLSLICCFTMAHSAFAGLNHTVTDMCGRSVLLPEKLERIACMHCVSPEKIMTLGFGDTIEAMAPQSPWALHFFPEIAGAASNRGIEPDDLKNLGIEAILYTPGMTDSSPFSSTGIPTVCAFSADSRPMDVRAYVANFTRQVALFGQLFGRGGITRAERYNRYFEKTVAEIMAMTRDIPVEKRPKVYYGGLRSDMLRSQGMGSVMHWIVEIAGGNYLPARLPDNHAKTTVEQVQSWNPDIILLSGMCPSKEPLLEDARWQQLDAVQQGRVYLLPQGVYAWDHASNEGTLLMVYLAKLFYPERFASWDMRAEMRHLYQGIYERHVSPEDLDRILAHQPPR